MQRNSNTLFLVAPGATTLVPWVYNAPDFTAFTEPTLPVEVDGAPDFTGFTEPTLSVLVDGAPDFSGFTEPTLSVLQTAWDDFLASGQELEVIPDLLPPAPEPEPDWTAFNTAMLLDPDWTPWITQNPLLMAATTSASMNRNAPELQTTIETAVAVLGAPDPVAAQRWQSIADANYIPIQF